MSTRGKDFRCELDESLHAKLKTMADFQGEDLSRTGARLLEKAIAGEWHWFEKLASRLDKQRGGRE